MQRRAKALIEMVLKIVVSLQISFPSRKISVMVVALRMDGLPSTRKAYTIRINMSRT
jgi:hypothetical protein